jgi:hypothetical protein
LVAKKAGDGEILVSLGSNNANAGESPILKHFVFLRLRVFMAPCLFLSLVALDPPYLLESMPPVQKQSRSLKAKSGKHMHWTLSDTSAWIPFPVISHAEAGHIHIHRNKDADAVQVWMLGVDDGGEKKENWLDITEEYETCGTEDGQATIRHPVFLDLVLRRRPETNAPSFVKEKVKEKEKVGAKKDKDADPGPIRKSSRKGKAREFLNI